MGYTTNFRGKINLDKPLTAAQVLYLMKFNKTRRMKRNASKTAKLPDPWRKGVGLEVGIQGGYYVGGEEYSSDRTNDVEDHNKPPQGQPGLWCQWKPTEDGTAIEWDGGEKFYDYIDWMKYIIAHFLKPWGIVANGRITWQGEEHGDTGTLIVENNEVCTVEGHYPNEAAEMAGFDEFLQDACMKLNDLWVESGGSEMKSGELRALNETLTAFFGDKR
jgi:hypothetical protein